MVFTSDRADSARSSLAPSDYCFALLQITRLLSSSLHIHSGMSGLTVLALVKTSMVFICVCPSNSASSVLFSSPQWLLFIMHSIRHPGLPLCEYLRPPSSISATEILSRIKRSSYFWIKWSLWKLIFEEVNISKLHGKNIVIKQSVWY